LPDAPRQDSGPILAQQEVDVPPEIGHAQLLQQLFLRGAAMLLAELPGALDGSARARAVPQAESGATAAPKVRPEEGFLDWRQPARALHNRVRAFSSWPGARGAFTLDGEPLTLKVLESRVSAEAAAERLRVTLSPRPGLPAALLVPCGNGEALELLSVQAAGGRPMAGSAYWAGLRGRVLLPVAPPSTPTPA
jgi:methionyl-tRNA formyltransferase